MRNAYCVMRNVVFQCSDFGVGGQGVGEGGVAGGLVGMAFMACLIVLLFWHGNDLIGASW